MSIWGKILGEGGSQILKPIADIIDNVSTNKEEKIKAETAMKEVLLQFELAVEQEWTKRETALLNDVANARAMLMKAMDNQDKFIRRFQYYLASGVMLGAFAMWAIILTKSYDPEQKEIVFTLTATLSSMVMLILGFFFGSTRGSENKNETIKNLSKNTGDK